MPTPQITVRVHRDVLDDWQEQCRLNETDVSTQVRKLMNAWVLVDGKQRELASLLDATLPSSGPS